MVTTFFSPFPFAISPSSPCLAPPFATAAGGGNGGADGGARLGRGGGGGAPLGGAVSGIGGGGGGEPGGPALNGGGGGGGTSKLEMGGTDGVDGLLMGVVSLSWSPVAERGLGGAMVPNRMEARCLALPPPEVRSGSSSEEFSVESTTDHSSSSGRARDGR